MTGSDYAAPGPAEVASTSGESHAGAVKRFLPLAAIVVGIVWFTGGLDKPLSSVGLNKEPCVQNAFGATFCGDDAKRLCREFGGPACPDLGLPAKGNLERRLDTLDPGY